MVMRLGEAVIYMVHSKNTCKVIKSCYHLKVGEKMCGTGE
jgi:hypothetical protein